MPYVGKMSILMTKASVLWAKERKRKEIHNWRHQT